MAKAFGEGLPDRETLTRSLNRVFRFVTGVDKPLAPEEYKGWWAVAGRADTALAKFHGETFERIGRELFDEYLFATTGSVGSMRAWRELSVEQRAAWEVMARHAHACLNGDLDEHGGLGAVEDSWRNWPVGPTPDSCTGVVRVGGLRRAGPPADEETAAASS